MSLKIKRNESCICGSGKKFKNCCLDKGGFELGERVIGVEKEVTEIEINRMLFGEGLEDLTEDLIRKLVENGWKKETLLFLKDRGGKYCRERNSIIEPPFFGE